MPGRLEWHGFVHRRAALAVFGSLGRTVWGVGDDSTRWLASVGVSVKVKN